MTVGGEFTGGEFTGGEVTINPVASELSWLERQTGVSRSRAQTPLKSNSQLRRSQPSLICDVLHILNKVPEL